jgi:Fe-S-cluster containining protein
VNPCDGCAADCCRGYEVVLFGWDAVRIARARPFDEFVTLAGAPEPDVNHQLLLDATLPIGQRSYHQLELRRVPDARLPLRCTFLVENRCSIYETRPCACRAYPVQFTDGLLTLRRRDYCPPGAWDTFDEAAFRAHNLFAHRQWRIHDAVTDGWNERVILGRERRTAAELFDYFVATYDALELAHPSWLDERDLTMPPDEEVRAAVEAARPQR